MPAFFDYSSAVFACLTLAEIGSDRQSSDARVLLACEDHWNAPESVIEQQTYSLCPLMLLGRAERVGFITLRTVAEPSDPIADPRVARHRDVSLHRLEPPRQESSLTWYRSCAVAG